MRGREIERALLKPIENDPNIIVLKHHLVFTFKVCFLMDFNSAFIILPQHMILDTICLTNRVIDFG